jgi:putative transposase
MITRRPNSLRLQGYDCSQAGMYFVTGVVKDRKPVFGEIVNETMLLNDAGTIVQGVWNSLPKQYPVMLDEFIIMPNHLHGIIALQNTVPTTENSLTNVGVGLAQPQKPIIFNDKPKTNSRPAQHESQQNTTSSHTTQNKSSTNDATRVGLESSSNHPPTSFIPNDDKRPTPTLMNDKRIFLSDVIRFFKSLSAKRINILYKTPRKPLWQNGFHDRIIRDEEELNAVRSYIQTNSLRWKLDKDV